MLQFLPHMRQYLSRRHWTADLHSRCNNMEGRTEHPLMKWATASLRYRAGRDTPRRPRTRRMLWCSRTSVWWAPLLGNILKWRGKAFHISAECRATHHRKRILFTLLDWCSCCKGSGSSGGGDGGSSSRHRGCWCYCGSGNGTILGAIVPNSSYLHTC